MTPGVSLQGVDPVKQRDRTTAKMVKLEAEAREVGLAAVKVIR